MKPNRLLILFIVVAMAMGFVGLSLEIAGASAAQGEPNAVAGGIATLHSAPGQPAENASHSSVHSTNYSPQAPRSNSAMMPGFLASENHLLAPTPDHLAMGRMNGSLSVTGDAVVPDGIQALQVVLPGFTIDLAYDAVLGKVNPGDNVLVTIGTSYGAAVADAVGFFWTPLWQASGAPLDLTGGESVEIYVNGALADTISLAAISGGVGVVDDLVSGNLGGLADGIAVTATLGGWGYLPVPGAPFVAGLTDPSGNFSLAFDEVDLTPGNLAQLDYQASEQTHVRTYLRPDPATMVIVNGNRAVGYVNPYQHVQVTAYNTYPTEIIWQAEADADQNGYYDVLGNWDAQPAGSVFEAVVGGSFAISTTLADLHDITFDANLDQVSGTAPAGEDVLIFFNAWQDDHQVYTETLITADGSGAFNASFSADLLPRDEVGVFVHDADGNSTAILGGAPYIDVILYDSFDCVEGRVDAPNQPVVLSLQNSTGIYTRTAITFPSGAGNELLPGTNCYSIRGEGWGPLAFEPGDILTVQSPSWSGSLTIPEITWQPDTVTDQIEGEAPDGDIRLDVMRWNAMEFIGEWGTRRMAAVSGGGFSADFSAFDLRDADWVLFRHYAADTGFGAQWLSGEDIHYFNVYAPWGVSGEVNTPYEMVTAYLYDDVGNLLASPSVQANPLEFWIGAFQSQLFAPGYWITVTGSSGWEAGFQIPDLNIVVDEAADLISGLAPQDRLFIETTWGFNGFVPSLGMAGDPSFMLNTNAFGYDLQWGDNAGIFYTAPAGDRFWAVGRIPQMYAHYGHSTQDNQVWGNGAESNATLPLTVTAPGGSVVATATLQANVFGDFHTADLPAGSVIPGNLVSIEFNGVAESLEVLSIVHEADIDTDVVTLTVNAPAGTPIYMNADGPHGWWESGWSYNGMVVGPDQTVVFDMSVDGYDLVLGTVFNVYTTQYHNHVTQYSFWLPVLNIRTNYGHDWIEGNFEAGHTLWLTVTNSSGEIKATASGVTGLIPWWGDQEGFSTNHNIIWDGPQPNLQAGDWVYASLDTGLTAESQLGVVEAAVDVSADSVAGTIDAPWYTEPLRGDCGIWEDGGPGIGFDVDPNAGAFTCDFSGQWDILPGHMIGVSYNEPDGDQVINMAINPAPFLRIWSWLPGALASGSNASFSIAYRNEGDAATQDAIISATLEGGLTYISDTSGLPVTGTGAPDDPLIWQLGTLPADRQDRYFSLFVAVTAAPGEIVTLITQIENGTPYDQDDWGAKYNELETPVQENDTHLNIGKGAWTWDPAPGTAFVYWMQVCNNGSTASADVIMTDTLPLSTTLITWWGEQTGWEEVSRSDHELVVTRPSAAGYQCNRVNVQVALDANAWIGMPLHNVASVSASNDLEVDDNLTEIWHNVGAPHANLSVNKNWNWGSLTPGGEIRYNLNYNNNGNIPVAGVRLTDTLPVDTTFVAAYWYDDAGAHALLPDVNANGLVAWELGTLLAGYNRGFEIILQIDEDALPGTELVNTAEITRLPVEDRYDDNQSSVIEMLYDHGPNLRVRQEGNWHGDGEGHNAWYQLIVENVGDMQVAFATITDTLPAGMELDGDPNTDWGSVENYVRDDAEGWFSFTFRDLHPNWRRDVNMNVFNPDPAAVPGGLLFTNHAEFGQLLGEPTYADNASDYTLFTGPNLYVEKNLVAGEVLPGEMVTYSLLFGNDQMGHTWWWNLQGTAWLTDTLPAGAEVINAVQRWCGDTFWCPVDPDVQNGQLIWQLWPIGGEQWNEFYVTVRLPDTLTGLDTVINQAEIASDQPQNDVEVDYSDNLAVSALPVMLPYFDVTKTYAGNGVAGTLVTYTLIVENMGNAPASEVVLTDQLPGGLTYLGGGELDSNVVSWTFSDVIPPLGSVASEQFWGRLACSVGTVVNNQHYQVTSSAQGITSTAGAPISFSISAPSINVDAAASAVDVLPDVPVAFTATATTDGSALSYTWDFGAGQSLVGEHVEHTFTLPGTYTVTVTATDQCGFTTTDTIQIQVISLKIYLPLITRNP